MGGGLDFAAVRDQSSSLLVCVASGVVAAGLLLPGLLTGPNFDASVFLLIGERLLEGSRPYVDLWDHKPPGIYFIDAALLATGGRIVGAWPAIWIGSVAAHAVLGVTVFSILRPAAGLRPAALAALITVAVASAWPIALGGGLTETFAVVLATLGFLIAIRSTTVGGAIPAGLVLGGACAISLYALPAVMAAITVAFTRAGVGRAAGVLAGAAVVAGGVALVATATATLPAMVDAVVTYNAAYREAGATHALPENLAISARLLVWYVAIGAVLVVPAIVGAWRGLSTVATRALTASMLLWIASFGLFVGIGGRLYGHYLLLVVPPLGVLAGVGFAAAGRWWSTTPAVRLALALGMALAIGISGAAIYASDLTSARDAHGLRDQDMAVAAYLRASTDSGDTVVVFGNAPMVYVLSDTQPAWRYPYVLPLLTPGYVSQELVTQIVDRIANEPPCYVIDAGSAAPGEPGLPPLLIDRPVIASDRQEDLLDPLRDLVAQRYRLDATVDGWPVYELRAGCR